ncbi:MAG: flagellar hook basal-body protein [Planctomycetota bacterium]
MIAGEKRMESITANLANANTPGFKRRLTTDHGAWVGRKDVRQTGLVVSQRNDFSQGVLQNTGNEFDLAIQGQGFFAVEGPEGEIYTRDGEFHLTSDGVILTPEGYPLAWTTGANAVQPTGEPVMIGEDGTVIQGGVQIGSLRLVEFDQLARLEHTGDGYWVAPPTLPRNKATGALIQYHLEGSNVNPVHELVSMITIQRRFEQASQTLTQIDQSYRRLHEQR